MIFFYYLVSLIYFYQIRSAMGLLSYFNPIYFFDDYLLCMFAT